MNPKYPKEEYIDFDMPSDDMESHVLLYKSKLVKKRTESRCLYCGEPIKKGEYAVSAHGFIEGMDGNKPFRFDHCMDCVDGEMDISNGKMDREEYYKAWEQRALRNGVIR